MGPLPQQPGPSPDSAVDRLKRKLRVLEGGSSGEKSSDSAGANAFGPLPKAERIDYSAPPPSTSSAKQDRSAYVAEDPLTDAWYFVRGLGEGLLYIPQRIAEIAEKPEQYAKDVNLLMSGDYLKESTGVVLNAMTDNWKDDEGNWALGEAFAKRPVSSISDLFAIKSLIAKSGGLAAKAAGGTSRAKLTAELAAKLGPMSKADKFLAFAEKLDKAPFPEIKKLFQKKAPKTSKDIADAFGLGEFTADLKRMKANEYASESIAAGDNIQKLAYKGLTDDDKLALRRAIRVGGAEDIVALTPPARKWYDSFRSLVLGDEDDVAKAASAASGATPSGQEPFLKAKNLLSEKRAFLANAQAAALEMFGEVNRENVRKAAALMKEGKITPIYASLFRVKDSGVDMFDTLGQNFRKLIGKAGRLEGRTGKGAYETDIVTTAIKQTKAFHSLKARVRFLDRTVEFLAKKGKAIPIRHLDELPPGYVPLQHAVYKRYFEVAARAGAARLRALMGGASETQAARKAYAEIMGDDKLRKEIAKAQHVAVPRHVARYIELELGIPGPVGRIYDKLANYWKAAATVFRPQYWLSVAVGNGLISGIHGVGPEDLALARKLKAALPPEIRGMMQGRVDLPDATLYERVAGNFREYASALDEMLLRHPVFAHEAEKIRREIHDTLMRAGENFFSAVDAIDDPYKFAQLVAASPEKLSETSRSIQTLYEQVAATMPEANSIIRAKNKLMERIPKMELEVAAQLDKVLGTVPTYRTKQLMDRLRKLEEEAEAMRARVSPTMEAQRSAVQTVKRGKEAIEADIAEQIRKLDLEPSTEEKAALQARLGDLQKERQALLTSRESAEGSSAAAKREIRRGKSGLTRDLAKALADEEREAAKFYANILADIRQRGGLRRVPDLPESTPLGLLGTKERGILPDELAQELFDRGLIGQPYVDDLVDFLDTARGAVLAARTAVQNSKARARVLASGRLNEAINELVKNVRERVRINQQLARIAKEEKNAVRTVQDVGIKADAKASARAEYNKALQTLLDATKGSVEQRQQAKLLSKRILEARRALTGEEQAQIGKAAALRRDLQEAQQRVVDMDAKLMDMAAVNVEKLTEAGRLGKMMPELEQTAKWADDAIVAGNRIAGDWLRMHPIERSFFSRMVPFWGYSKMMAMFVARLPFMYPKRVFLWNRWSQLVMEQRNMDEFPEWLRDYVPVGHSADGSTAYVRLGGLFPWGGTRVGELGQIPIPGLLDPAQSNPLIKVFMDLSGATPRWSKRPWSTDETMTRLDNGEVYKFRNGRFEKTIPQPSLWRSLWYMFPTSQLIEEALIPYVMTDRGWIGFREPIQKPNGEVMYPKAMGERLLNLIGPKVIIRDPEEFKRMERSKHMRAIKSYMGDIRQATPEKREAMMEVLRDAVESGQKRFGT